MTDAQGQLGDTLRLPNAASKGERGGREIPLAVDLQRVLAGSTAMVGRPGRS